MAKQDTYVSGWAGWIGFAAIMLTIVGIFHLIAGIVALFNSDVYAVTSSTVWVLDLTQWGWIHVIAGLIAFTAAASLVKGNVYGRIIAVAFAVASIVANMAFVPIYPIWSLMMVTIGVLVIWAVVVHGKEVRAL
ncbi:MAG: hypothetical protein V4611_02340 [Patescibacteria group bacterium]